MSRAKPRISVAMCTYNGSRHVLEQLESIVSQTRSVDEIVVCDDASSDDTLSLLHEFAGQTRIPFRIERNERNIGFLQNFSKAMQLCTGDLIFPSDQDDIWRPDKVAAIEALFESRPDVDMVFTDADLVYDDLSPVGYTIWESIQFNARRKKMVRNGRRFLDLLMNRNVVTGATMAFRADLRELILPFQGRWVHDAWIATIVACVGRAEFIERPLILYRQHANQQLGGLKLSLLKQFEVARKMDATHFNNLADDYTAVLGRLSAFQGRLVYPETLTMLREKIDHLRTRAELRSKGWGRIPIVAGEILKLRYHRYSLGLLSIVQDLVLA